MKSKISKETKGYKIITDDLGNIILIYKCHVDGVMDTDRKVIERIAKKHDEYCKFCESCNICYLEGKHDYWCPKLKEK